MSTSTGAVVDRQGRISSRTKLGVAYAEVQQLIKTQQEILRRSELAARLGVPYPTRARDEVRRRHSAADVVGHFHVGAKSDSAEFAIRRLLDYVQSGRVDPDYAIAVALGRPLTDSEMDRCWAADKNSDTVSASGASVVENESRRPRKAGVRQ